MSASSSDRHTAPAAPGWIGHLRRTGRARLRPLARCERGNAAIEFGLLGPVFLVILAGIVDLGLVIHARFQLDTELSSAANYSVMQAGDAPSAETFAKLIAGQLHAGGVERATVVFNNAATATLEGGVIDADPTGANAGNCYCPVDPPDEEMSWNLTNCESQCPNKASPGRFVEITATSMHESMFGRYGLLDNKVTVRTLARID